MPTIMNADVWCKHWHAGGANASFIYERNICTNVLRCRRFETKKSTRPEHVHRLSQLVVSHGLKTVILEFVPIRGAS